MVEITAGFLDDLYEIGIPFHYVGVTQFIELSERKCKIVCLYEDGCWDSRNINIDLDDKCLLNEYDLDEDDSRLKEKLIERINDCFFGNYEKLLRECHRPENKDFKDMDDAILNFSSTYLEMNKWLCTRVPDYYFTDYEKNEINEMISLVKSKRFNSLGDKRKFWEDIIILSKEYFPNRNIDDLERIVQTIDYEIVKSELF